MTVKEAKEIKTEDLIIRISQVATVDKKWARNEERRIIKELSRRYDLDEAYLIKKIVEY